MKIKEGFIAAVILFLTMSVTPLRADVFQGTVVGVIDGDTMIVYDSLTLISYTVCFADAEAPELGQIDGAEARNYLSNIAFGRHVIVTYNETDPYGRIVGRVYTDDGRELGLRMIQAGFAWHNNTFYNDAAYAQAQIVARAAKIGSWLALNPVAPWDYRARKPGPPPAPRHPAPSSRRPPAPPVPPAHYGHPDRPHAAPPKPAPHSPAPSPRPGGKPGPKPAPSSHKAPPPPSPRPGAPNGARPAPAPKPAPGHVGNPSPKPGAHPAPKPGGRPAPKPAPRHRGRP